MKKKTKYKLRNDLFVPFVFAVLICLCGALIFSYLLYRSVFLSLSKMDEKPVAYVSFKNKISQRKFLNRVVWDRLRLNSPLYNGDTVLTSDDSQMMVLFNDGTILELYENTMTQIFYTEENGISADVKNGTAILDAKNSLASSKVTVMMNEEEVVVYAGSSVKVNSFDDSDTSFDVLSGSGVYSKGSLFTKEIGVGESSKQFASNLSQLGIALGSNVSLSSVSVFEPKPYALYVQENSRSFNVPFRWKMYNVSGEKIWIEFSSDKRFKNIVSSFDVTDIYEKNIQLPSGIYWWRIKIEDESHFVRYGSSGKIDLVYVTKAQSVSPDLNSVIDYRSKLPQVKFVWTEATVSDGILCDYDVEVSKTEDFSEIIYSVNTKNHSVNASCFAEGKYWWRVVTNYTNGSEKYSFNSDSLWFDIKQKGALDAVEVIFPKNESFVNVHPSCGEVMFSWKNCIEAEKYTIEIADNAGFSRPLVKENLYNNYFVYSNISKLAKKDKWFWRVYYTDSNGEVSEESLLNCFYVYEDAPAVKIVDPLDGYVCDASLIQDLTFNWKYNMNSNVDFEFTIYDDRNKSNVLYQCKIKSFGIHGINLRDGKYYWQVKCRDDKGFESVSELNELVVSKGLNATDFKFFGSNVLIHNDNTAYFSWDSVDEAEYYKLKIYDAEYENIIYSKNVYDTQVLISLDEINGDGVYTSESFVLEIQPQLSGEAGVTSRRTGFITVKEFSFVHGNTVELVMPEKNEIYSSVETSVNSIPVEWKCNEKLYSAQVVVKRVGNNEVVYKNPSDSQMKNGILIAPKSFDLPSDVVKNPGEYEIVVYTINSEGTDISNVDEKTVGKFTVVETEPLEVCEIRSVKPAFLDYEYFIRTGKAQVNILWTSVKDADEYIVQIFNEKGEVLYEKSAGQNTSFAFDFVKLNSRERNIFTKGKFYIGIKAVQKSRAHFSEADNLIIQESVSELKEFQINMEMESSVSGSGVSNTYGRSGN